MSRNFDVLRRLEEDRELFRVSPVTKSLPLNGGHRSSRVSLRDVEAFTHKEVLKLVQRLFLATDGNGCNLPRRVVFCGIDETDGSNFLCAQIGRNLASQVESQVCLVNANVRPPNWLFDVDESDLPIMQSGFTKMCLQRVENNLWLLPSNPVATERGSRGLAQMRACIRDLGDQFGYVVISAPPAGLSSDAALLGQIADGVVLVLEAHSTRRETARQAKHALEAANVPILGTVLNNRTFPIPEALYRKI